jgi:hypothetical protein
MDSAKTCKELSEVFAKIDANWDDMHGMMLQSLQGYKFRDERIKEEWLRNVLKDALPPIRGKITKGKLKWRGIKLYIHTGARSSMYEVMQRGVRLGLLRVVDCQRDDFSREIFYISDNPKHIPKDIQGVDFFATPVPTCSG